MSHQDNSIPSPHAEYALSIRQGVWTLRRDGRLLMRSRAEARVREAWQREAMLDAVKTGRSVVASEDAGDGLIIERIWTPEDAGAALGRIARMLSDDLASVPYPEGGDS